jgi:uncharacterized repeat protein (TIGR02543 family)
MKLSHSAKLVLLFGALLVSCGGTGGMQNTLVGEIDVATEALSSNGVNATLSLQSDWGAGYCANVVLANTSSSAVTSWTVVVELNQSTLSQLWSGMHTQSGTQITVTPTDYNASIAPGASTSFGFCGYATGSDYLPTLASMSVVGGGSGDPTSYTLIVQTSGEGSTSPAAGSYSYAAGTAVEVTATPAAGYVFTGWSDAATGTTNPVTITMDGDKTLTANFSPGTTTRYTLAIGASGSGTTNPAPGTHTYDSGASVMVTATAAAGATFTGWSGAATGTTNPVTITMDGDKTLTANFSTVTPQSYTNPVLWEDLADIDIIRVGDLYYYSASTMHYSPGAPILRSYDLVNWEFAGHSVPVLDWGAAYDLNGGRAYVKGIWASSLNYRSSNNTFYWIGCIEFNRTYVYTATSVEGPWQQRSQINNCYFDVGLLIDSDDSMYVAYGNTQISVAQLSSDGFSQVRSQQVYSSSVGTIEGSRFYKINGNYYIFVTKPANGQYVLKANSPWGPYTIKQLLLNMGTPVSGGGVPHQGGLVETQNGDWYYMAFVDAFPGGRIPVLAPITWGSDGFPVIQTVNGAWGVSYPYPNVPTPPHAMKPPTGTDTFSGTTLGPEWEWNHNPDNTNWSVNNGLTLQTATVTNDLYNARNTLTHRILGPTSTATIVLNYGNMRDGDRAGFALLRDSSAWIGIKRDNGANRVVMVNNLTMDSNWNTTGTGTEVAGTAVSGGKIWLRIAADIRPGTGRQGRFYYSADGVNFTQLGSFTMGNAWQFFMGYRYAIFNYATQALGGLVTVDSFTMTTP